VRGNVDIVAYLLEKGLICLIYSHYDCLASADIVRYDFGCYIRSAQENLVKYVGTSTDHSIPNGTNFVDDNN
jgi:hypothetical protein